ncbi:TPA: N-acetyltransferase [Candidatus Ventrenecus stercoripullorum]|nr:N-acetyltransferase [Candidatus Ventrenecus stercoripullorum]
MVQILWNKKENQAVALDEEKVIGICEFIEEKDTWNIIHTEVDENYRGQKIAKRLVMKVIEEAKNEKKKVIADCSYAQKILES